MTSEKDLRVESDSMGSIEVPADRYWGAQTQRSFENFRIGGERMPLGLVHALGIQKKAAALANMRLGELEPEVGRGHRLGRRRSDRRNPRRSLPAGRLADRIGHPEQHERQRGHRQSCDRDARRHPRDEDAGTPQRSRQPLAIVERQLSGGDAHRRGAGLQPPPAAGASRAPRGAGGEGAGLRRHHQDRPDPHPGRNAAEPGPGVFRLCGADRMRDRAGRGRSAADPAPGPGRHRRRHRTEHGGRLRRSLRRRGRPNHRLCLRHRAEQVRGAGGPRRSRRRLGRAERPCGLIEQDRQRHPLPRLRPAQRSRRADPAGERARLVDHAGKGEPHPVRGPDPGLRAGDGQPRRPSPSPAPPDISSSTSSSR